MSNIETTRVMGAAGAAQDRTLVIPGGSSATIAMPGQADAFRTQMGGTTTCPVCNSTTPLMETYCGDCGFLLASTPAENIAPPTDEKPAAELVDPLTGRRFRLREGVNTLGRQGTDILVNEGTVSRNHARITIENGAVTVEDLGSSNGTKVGDQRLTANQPVTAVPGQGLRFGNWNVTLDMGTGTGFQAAPADATMAMPSAIESPETSAAGSAFSDEDTFIASAVTAHSLPLPATSNVESVTGGALVGTLRKTEGPADDIAVTEGVISIGRRPENTVILVADAYASGRHAEVVTDATGTYITDLGSTNGTVVNGVRITPNERLLLSEGDELQIGQNRFRFEPFSQEASLDGEQPENSTDETPGEVGRD